VALFRRRRLPADQRPALERDERILAWAAAWSGPQGEAARARPGGAGGDQVVVATNLGVWLPGTVARLGWHEIHKATWSGRNLALVASREVREADGYTVVEDLPAVVHTLLDPDEVPAQVRARVTRSVAYTQHHPLPGGGGVRVVARRVPGVNGLRWTVRYDEGVDPVADEVSAMTADLVAHGRASTEVDVP
jgi:hypothetical protein